MTVHASGFADLARNLDAEVDEAIMADVREVFIGIFEDVVAQAPHLTGQFAASFVPYASNPPLDEPGEGETTPRGVADVEAVLAEWDGEEPLGIVTNLPQARRLIFHGWSKQVPRGWVDAILAANVRG